MDHRESLASRTARRKFVVTPERWQRIKEIFQSAAQLPPADRDAWVAAQTTGDIELRNEIEEMLRYVSGAGLLDTPAWEGLRIETGIEPGAHLGPYEILAEVGSGGMGRVYKARDTRLERIVAIKVLNAEFSHRLRTEGRAISALNHPNVCALYDIGDQDGTAYLVMEYVEGESLAACLGRGPLPVDAVLRYGAEIAGALAAAHAQGIVHRDLKPANIMITTSGAKVLDFGVARMAEDDQTSSEAVVGTAAYMSPSQWNGSPADTRSDIFALGLVLCEMVTGARRSRESRDTLENVPAGLAILIRQCLEQDAARRVQRMEEVRHALDNLRSETAGASKRRWIRPAAVATLLGLVAATAVVTWKVIASHPQLPPRPAAATMATNPVTPPPTPAAAAREDVAPPTSVLKAPSRRRPASPPPPPSLRTLASYPGMERDPSFSPDGARVAFSWRRGGRSGYGIYVRSVESENTPVALTEGNYEDWGPAWSPDGGRIAFRRRGGQSGIYWVSASGGPENLIAPIARQNQETLPQLSWSRDGKWIAAPDRGSLGSTQIYLIATETGERRPLTSNTIGTDHAPAFSPDGKALAYASCRSGVYPCDVYVIDFGRDLAPRQERRITDQGLYLRGIAWLPDGRSLVYSAGRRSSAETSLWRVAVNPPGLPEPIDLAGTQARHPTISFTGGLLAYTRLNNWSLMMIQNFR
jgi:serine/threonine protein kinase/Tol biopolymer transport system component